MAKKNLEIILFAVVCLVAVPSWGTTYSPASPFTAVNSQGRPLVGGTVSVTNSVGVPVTVYADTMGASLYSGVVPATGVVQFFGTSGIYIVTISSQGTTRQYYVSIPAGADAITDSQFPAAGGWMQKLAANSYTANKVNLSATVDPAITDDGAAGYTVGSIWVNINSNNIFFCTDSSNGAAVWRTNGSAITSINGLTNPAITFVTTAIGTDFNITTSGGNTVSLNIPSMGAGKTRGLLTNSNQDILGPKIFSDFATFKDIINVNTLQGGGVSIFSTSGWVRALAIDGTNDQVTFFKNTSAGSISTRIYAESIDSDDTFYMTNLAGYNALHAFTDGSTGGGFAVVATAENSSTGGGLEASASGSPNAVAARFTRSTAGSTVPVTNIRRNVSTDAQSLLKMEDQTATTTATYALDYFLNSVRKFGLRTNGQIVSVLTGTTPAFSFIGDEDSGFSEFGGNPAVYDEGTLLATFGTALVQILGTANISLTSSADISLNAATLTMVGTAGLLGDLAIAGEISVTGVSGTGKTICVKSDANFGVCSDAPNGSGICTCG